MIQPDSMMSLVMFNGPPGVGKTRIFSDRIRQESVLREVTYEEIGVINARNLVQKLWQYRDGGLLSPTTPTFCLLTLTNTWERSSRPRSAQPFRLI
jgi:hypothetical protein